MSNIAIIEDDDLMRGLLREWLTAAGYAVREHALREVPGDKADLVIVDLYMPRQGGAQIMREIKRAHPATPVIVISGQFHAALATSCTAARTLGAEHVIAKPFTSDDLLSAVHATIGAAA